MIICKHRVNSVDELKKLPNNFGVEIDIRSNLDEIYLAHDPFQAGERLEDWLEFYEHKFIILNVKEEGLENKVRSMLEERQIDSWAFLDQSFPFLVKELKQKLTKTMVRVSNFESHLTALSLNPKPDWVWLDSFDGKYPYFSKLFELKKSNYKFMLVSPELQGRDSLEEIGEVREIFRRNDFELDGVCTKSPEFWI